MSIITPNVQYKVSKLSCGMRLASVPVQSELGTVGFWVKSGSVYETAENNGVSHYLEHIIFHGNEKYGRKDLEGLADETGINIKAATSRTYTKFFAQAESHQLPKAIEVLSQIVMNPAIKDSSVEEERSTIFEEDLDVSHDFSETTWDSLHALSFPDSPLGFKILGSRKNIGSITPKQIRDQHSKFYNPSNMILTCASNIPHEKLIEIAEKALSFVKKQPPLDIEAIDNKISYQFHPKSQFFSSPYLDRSWIGLASRAPEVTHPLYVPCALIRESIGEVMGDRPFERPPHFSSVMHHLQTFHFSYNKVGLFVMLGSVESGREQEWVNNVLQNLQKYTMECTPEMLSMGKMRLKHRINVAESSSDVVADELGQGLLFNAWHPPAEWAQLIDNVKREDLQRYAMEFLHKTPFATAFVFPKKLIDEQKNIQNQNRSKEEKTKEVKKEAKPKSSLILP